MISWEYKSTEIKILDIEKSLNKLGKDGWKLVHLEGLPGIYRAFLERPMTTHSMLGID